MLKRIIVALGFLIGAAGGALAFDVAAMSDDERAAFRAEIRAYLIEHPEVLVEAISVLEERQAQAQANGEAALLSQYADQIYNDGFSYIGGNPEGDITLVEFLDYRCGYCKRAHPDVVALLENDTNIRLIVKEFPILGEQSTLASRFALSAKLIGGDAAYVAIHDHLMRANGAISTQSLRRAATALGFDGEAIVAGMNDPEIDKILAANAGLARALSISGTPSFILGDTMIRGYAPLATMQEMVAQQRG